ncbi:MAG TPA: M28 family peptidase [Gemmatimonadaceae bacterium]|nr:M28 family peptidase [Gemmatimonadaceae bacterium]
MRSPTRRGLIQRLIAYPALLLLALAALWAVSIRMPGESFEAPLPALTAEQSASSEQLRAHVEMLAGRIGERNYMRLGALDSAATYVHQVFAALGYTVTEQTYVAGGKTYRNIEAVLPGRSRAKEIVLVGGHYDSVFDSPGADDNASGMASVLELARLMRSVAGERTLKFVAFANEEPPFFYSDSMGSLVYARAARARGDDIVAMLSMETLGYYTDSAGTQKYPPILGWFYPDRGSYVGVVGNIGSRSLVHRVIRDFRASAQFPSAGAAAPTQLPGIAWSDHWSFWQAGYDAVMITDTAPFRNPNYHEISDRPASLDYDRMARAVHGVAAAVRSLANG